MYERHFGMRENPFAAGHQSKYVYPSREHQEALAHLRFGIENREPFVLITGEVGTGKTTALYDALSEWKSRAVVALITNSALTRSELYEEICMRFGVPVSGPVSKPQLIHQLERHLMVVRARGDFAVLIIDEAQNLDGGLLEETRLLSNFEAQGQKLLQIFLVGQPELEEKLAQSELRQLRQRIAVHYRLRPLSIEETALYIHHRIAVAGGDGPAVFPADACAEVHASTHGIPREINHVAAQALLNAFVEDAPCVRPEHVRTIVRDTGFHSVLDANAAPSASVVPSGAPPDAPRNMAAPAAPLQPVPVPPPSAEAPVHVSPPRDVPAPTREVRHVPPPAPASDRGETPPRTNHAEGQTMAGVRPAGSTESWQSWMESLQKQSETGEPGATEATQAEAAEPAAPAEPPSVEMTPEAFYAVEEEAMRAHIGDDEEEYEEDDEAPESSEPEIRHEFDPNESATGARAAEREESTPPSLETEELPVAARAEAVVSAPDFESAPGFNWDAPASRVEPPAEVPAQPAAQAEVFDFDRGAMPSPPALAPAEAEASPRPTTVPDDFAPIEPRPAPARGPVARVSSVPAQPLPTAAALPMRLRERIEAAEREEASSSHAGMWLVGAAVVAAVAIGVVLAFRFRKESAPVVAPAGVTSTATSPGATAPVASGAVPSATAPAAQPSAEASTPPPSAAQAEPPAAPVAAVVPRNPAPAPGSATTRPTPPAPKPEASTPAVGHEPVTKPAVAEKPAAPKPAAKAQYGVSVASYLAEERARTESARLASATGLPARVVTTADGDYLVVLGAFADRNAAETAAGRLISGGKVDEARVVPLAAGEKK